MSELRDDLNRIDIYRNNVIEDYPGGIMFGGYALAKWKFYGAGFEYQFNKTNGKKENSGNPELYTYNEEISSNSIGLKNRFSIKDCGNFSFGFDLGIGAILTNMTIKTGSVSNNLSRFDELSSRSFYIFPSVLAKYKIFPFMAAGINAGYFMDSRGKLRYDNEYDSDNSTDWSGLRVQISLSFSTFSKDVSSDKNNKTNQEKQ